jgi:putative oxidoreductase
MRVVFGFLFLCHGLQKYGMLGGEMRPFLSWPTGTAGFIEVVTGVLILIGLFTRAAAFVASGEMAAAYFMAHQPQGGLPIQNNGEPAVLYCFAFLYFAARGAGIWSVDAMRRGGRAV